MSVSYRLLRLSQRVRRLGLLRASLAAAVLVVTGTTASVAVSLSASASSPLSIRVSGNHLVDQSGNPVQLRGVDRSGTEYACVQGWGIFDGPSDATSVSAIASWHVNAVRVPLNEDCWLGINGVNAAYSGSNYQQAIVNYVNLLNQNGIYAILDLHWNAPGTSQATSQEPMADQDHAPAFWTSVANTFKGNPAAIFDLYNEPYPDSNQDTTAAWNCWLNGGSCPGVSYQAAGMQELVNTVRATGATNVVMLGGIQYGGTIDQWLNYEPNDPLGQIAASVHNYNFGSCVTVSCWNTWLPLVSKVPLVTGELGENDGAGSFISSYMNWADSNGVSYLGWTWDTWGCGSPISLITSYSGTPCSGYGSTYQSHLASVATSPPPTTTTTTAPATTTTTAPATTTTTAPATTTTTAPATTTTTAPATTTTTAPPTVAPAPTDPVTVDSQVSTNVAAGSSMVSPALTTTGSQELLVAFISSDGPAGQAQRVQSVKGGWLKWSLAARSNSQSGDAEVWTAVAPHPMSSLRVRAYMSSSGYEGSITVAGFNGTGNGRWTATARSAGSGAPSISLTSPATGSWLWAVGHDWDNAKSRTPSSGQTVDHQFVDYSMGDTSWVQYAADQNAPVGTSLTVSDTAPTGDQWNMAAVAIHP